MTPPPFVVVALAAGLALSASACGDGTIRSGQRAASVTGTPDPPASPAPAPTTRALSDPVPVADDNHEVLSTGPRRAVASSGDAPTRGGSTAGVPASSANSPASAFAVSAAVVPACVTPGSAFEVRMTSASHARLSMIVAYADSQPHGAMGFGDTDRAGTFSWPLVAPPDTPAGPATVLVGAQPAQGGDSASTRAPFVVASAGRCP